MKRWQNADGEASELVVIDSRTELCFPLHKAAIDRVLGAGLAKHKMV